MNLIIWSLICVLTLVNGTRIGGTVIVNVHWSVLVCVNQTLTRAVLRCHYGSFVSVVVISSVRTGGNVVRILRVHVVASSLLCFTVCDFSFGVFAHESDWHNDNLVVDESTRDQENEADDFLPDERLPLDGKRDDPNEKCSWCVDGGSLSCGGVLGDGDTCGVEGSNW